MALQAGIGCETELDSLIARTGCAPPDALFGEGPGGFVLAGDGAALEALGGQGVPVEMLGTAIGGDFRASAGGLALSVGLDRLRDAWESLPTLVEE